MAGALPIGMERDVIQTPAKERDNQHNHESLKHDDDPQHPFCCVAICPKFFNLRFKVADSRIE